MPAKTKKTTKHVKNKSSRPIYPVAAVALMLVPYRKKNNYLEKNKMIIRKKKE